MKYDPQTPETPVYCLVCDWVGIAQETEDQDVLGPDFQLLGLQCICPKCGGAVDVGVSGRSPDVSEALRMS